MTPRVDPTRTADQPRRSAGRQVITGAVAAGHPLSARAGARALAEGGTAADAVIAAALTSAVSESVLTGPGAGGFLMVRPPGGPATILDFFVAVPGLGPGGGRLDPADLHAFTVPFGTVEQVFHIGPASVAVPGMLAGLDEASRRFGRLPLRDLVAPAVSLARGGVAIGEEAAYLHRILADMLRHTPASAAQFTPHGRTCAAGEVLVLCDLADTLERFGDEGAACLYGGEVGQRILDYLEANGGLLTGDDLTAYRVQERTPVEVGFRDAVVLTNAPPSSGGVLIAAALDHLDRHAAPADEATLYSGMARAQAAANAMRGADFHEGVSDEGFLERFWAALRDAEESRTPPSRKPTGTTHVSAIDPEGGMASLSSSNGSGSGVVAPGTGVLLNNMMGESDLNPAGFGSLPPGIRMTSMMAPTLILRDGAPVAAVGSAGSNRLRSAILMVIAGMVDRADGPGAAVQRPRIHHEGDGIDVEGGVPAAAIAALEADGFDLRLWTETNLYFGGVSAVGMSGQGLQAAGDPRRGGGAAGVDDDGRVVDL
jgi:gamma-glutamyltranspeptidase / glutathione hydrolase